MGLVSWIKKKQEERYARKLKELTDRWNNITHDGSKESLNKERTFLWNVALGDADEAGKCSSKFYDWRQTRNSKDGSYTKQERTIDAYNQADRYLREKHDGKKHFWGWNADSIAYTRFVRNTLANEMINICRSGYRSCYENATVTQAPNEQVKKACLRASYLAAQYANTLIPRYRRLIDNLGAVTRKDDVDFMDNFYQDMLSFPESVINGEIEPSDLVQVIETCARKAARSASDYLSAAWTVRDTEKNIKLHERLSESAKEKSRAARQGLKKLEKDPISEYKNSTYGYVGMFAAEWRGKKAARQSDMDENEKEAVMYQEKATEYRSALPNAEAVRMAKLAVFKESAETFGKRKEAQTL